MGSRAKSFRYFLLGLALVLLILFVWEGAGRLGFISQLALPLPSHVLIAAARQLFLRRFWANWYGTLIVWLISWSTGLTLGLLLGFFAGASEKVSFILLPALGFFRSIPPIALFPVALIAIGPGGLPIGVVAAIGAALYVFPGTAEAAKTATQRFSHLAKILGSNRLQFFSTFVIPGAAIQALASSRVAATYAFAACVGGEMIIGGRSGVGAAILDFSERYYLEDAYAYVLYAGLVGLVIDTIFARLNRLRLISATRN